MAGNDTCPHHPLTLTHSPSLPPVLGSILLGLGTQLNAPPAVLWIHTLPSLEPPSATQLTGSSAHTFEQTHTHSSAHTFEQSHTSFLIRHHTCAVPMCSHGVTISSLTSTPLFLRGRARANSRASHRSASHRITSPRLASPRLASPRIASPRLASHPITPSGDIHTHTYRIACAI